MFGWVGILVGLVGIAVAVVHTITVHSFYFDFESLIHHTRTVSTILVLVLDPSRILAYKCNYT